jgi:hypothetical protein
MGGNTTWYPNQGTWRESDQDFISSSMKRKHTISMTLYKTIGKGFDEDFPSSSIKREYTYNIDMFWMSYQNM